MGKFEQGLDRRPAHDQPLIPVTLVERSAWIYRSKPAVLYGDRRTLYPEFYARCRRLASALRRSGVEAGDTVSVLAPNIRAMPEAHFGVPMAGAVLNKINIRLDARTVAQCLEHGEAKVFLVDREFSTLAGEASAVLSREPAVIDIEDSEASSGERLGTLTYEALLNEGDPESAWTPPEDEWAPIALNYTSGTTGNPKGVVYTPTEARVWPASVAPWLWRCRPGACTFGRCTCFTATAGVSRGASRQWAAPMSAWAGSMPDRSSASSASTASPTFAGRPSF